MKYFIVLGIEFIKYKNPAKILITIGKRLIDEFELEEDVPGSESNGGIRWPDFFDTFCTTHETLSKLKGSLPTILDEQPRLFKVYKVDEDYLNDDLVISVVNSNSDYTNGFMKKSSLIRFQVIAMFPETMMKGNSAKLFGTAKKIREAVITHSKTFKKDRISMMDTSSRVCWPAVYGYTPIFENKLTQNENINISSSYLNWYGGTFKIILPIKSKFRLKYLHHNKKGMHGFWFPTTDIVTFLSTCQSLINTINEDQRSNNAKD
jgi:hypothetical protein